MRVLLVNHTGQVSGAEHSLLDLIAHLPAHGVTPLLACPPEGPLADRASAAGATVLPIAGTAGSLRLHPTGTPRAGGELARTALQTARHARTAGAGLLHANSVRAGLVAVAAGRMARKPVITHVRDRLPRGRVADASLRVVAGGSALVLANSQYTADGVLAVAQPRALRSIANPVDLQRFDPDAIDRVRARARLGLAPWTLALGVVGQITPWKGQEEVVRAVALLAAIRPELRLLVAGEAKFVASTTRYDNRAYLTGIEHLIEQEGIGGQVALLGERADVPELMRALDLLLVPSWEEPFGRVVIEAMALGVPVLATAVGGPTEIVDDGETGFLLEPRDPERWAGAIDRLCSEDELRRRVGLAGRERAADFGSDAHAAAVASAYWSIS